VSDVRVGSLTACSEYARTDDQLVVTPCVDPEAITGIAQRQPDSGGATRCQPLRSPPPGPAQCTGPMWRATGGESLSASPTSMMTMPVPGVRSL